MILTDGGEDGEGVEESPGKVPLVVDDLLAGDVGAAGVGDRRAAEQVVGQRPNELLLKPRDLLRCQPRPVLVVEDVQLDRRVPEVLHSVDSCFVDLRMRKVIIRVSQSKNLVYNFSNFSLSVRYGELEFN